MRLAVLASVLCLLVVPGSVLAERDDGLSHAEGPGRRELAPSATSRSASTYWVREMRRRWLEQRAANRVNRRTIRRLRAQLAHRHHPIEYALRLASTVYGVPYWELRSVASCESGLNPYASNGIYRGVFQEGPMFERGPFASFGVWDPVANALTAAHTVAREGWSQWSCKP